MECQASVVHGSDEGIDDQDCIDCLAARWQSLLLCGPHYAEVHRAWKIEIFKGLVIPLKEKFIECGDPSCMTRKTIPGD